jgi:hypothetical protein
MMTRRDLRRQQTIDDIKDTARHQLANGGVPLENRILALTWVFPILRRLARTR